MDQTARCCCECLAGGSSGSRIGGCSVGTIGLGSRQSAGNHRAHLSAGCALSSSSSGSRHSLVLHVQRSRRRTTGDLDLSRVVDLAVLGDLECVVGSLREGDVRSPGVRSALSVRGKDFDVLQVGRWSFLESDGDGLYNVS